MRAAPRATPRRLDDPSAILDALSAHLLVALAIGAALSALRAPTFPGAPLLAIALSIATIARLFAHPIGRARLHRVYLDDDGTVRVAPSFGRARVVRPIAVEHVGHAAWPCALVLDGGARASFVARRDDGVPAFLLLQLSDRARYDGERACRDSLVELELATRGARASLTA